jgi:uncharacterized protein with HEPN domain
MNERTQKLLFDVLESGRSIRLWCAGRSFEEYMEDRQFRRAVEREFEIIGEALGRLARLDAETASHIGDLSRIVSFRNRIIHGYDTVDDAMVWGIVSEHLPRLISEAETLAGESDEPEGSS